MNDSPPSRSRRARVISGAAAISAKPRRARVIAEPIADAMIEAQALRQRAEREASRIVEDATAQAAAIAASARAEGETSAASAVLAAATLSQRLGERTRKQLMGLALSAAQKLASTVIDDDASVLRLVDEALVQHGQASLVRLRVCDRDAKVLADDSDFCRRAQQSRVTVEVDEALERGDCIVESERGLVDARMEIKLRNLRRAVGLADVERDE